MYGTQALSLSLKWRGKIEERAVRKLMVDKEGGR
jgi:hypothetical protein